MKTKHSSATRRNFLLGATVGTVGAVAAVVAGKQSAAPAVVASVAADPAAKVKGYHVTDHIQKYYETTKI